MGSCVSYISDSSHIGGLITGVPWFGAATIALSVSLVVIVFNYRSAGFHDGKPIPLLVVLKKDLKLSQAENAKKDAIIQYLLNFMVRNLTLAEHDAEKDRVTKKVFKDGIEELVSSIKDAIFTLSITNVGGIRPRDESRRCSEGPNDEIVETGDLIDLLSSNDETENTKLTEEDTTLLEELYDDMSDFEAVTANTLRSSSSNSFDSGFSESSYIVRFANCDPAHDFCGGIEHAGKVQYLPERINITDHSNSQANFLVPSIECDNSAHKDTSLPSCLDSKSTYSNASSREELTEDDAPGKNADSRIVPVATFGNHHRGFHSYTNGLNGSRCLVPTPSDHVLSLLQSSISLQNSSSVALAEPRWNTAKIFDSRSERDNAAIINQRDAGFKDLRFPDLFRYGVRYVPNDGERNVYLTVKIARLPVDITLIAVTNKVRGGMLVDVKLLYTAAITGTKTCLITFFQEDAALNFEEHCSRYSIIFNGVVAHVEAISTPTWPFPLNVMKAIRDYGHTRCFEVHNFPSHVTPTILKRELTMGPVTKETALEAMSMDDNGVLGLRFSSIKQAENASVLFTKTARYRGCTVNFLPDPCAQPLVEGASPQLLASPRMRA